MRKGNYLQNRRHVTVYPLQFSLERSVMNLGCWTFRYFASSPPGRFTTTFDDSLPGRFAVLGVSIPGRFATSLDVSPPVSKLVICVSVTTSVNLFFYFS